MLRNDSVPAVSQPVCQRPETAIPSSGWSAGPRPYRQRRSRPLSASSLGEPRPPSTGLARSRPRLTLHLDPLGRAPHGRRDEPRPKFDTEGRLARREPVVREPDEQAALADSCVADDYEFEDAGVSEVRRVRVEAERRGEVPVTEGLRLRAEVKPAKRLCRLQSEDATKALEPRGRALVELSGQRRSGHESTH